MTQALPDATDPTAVIGRRVVAYLIDAVIALVLVVVVFSIVASSVERESAAAAQALCDRLNTANSDFVCINSGTTVILANGDNMTTVGLVALVYFVATQLVLPTLTGFSPGKALVGLRVVNNATFEKAGFGAHVVRWLLWIVDSAPWCFPLVGLITGLSSKGHRRVGDMGAGTLVVDKQWLGQPCPVPGVNTVVAAFAPPPPATSPPFAPAMPPPPPFGSPAEAPPPPPSALDDPDATTALIAPIAPPPPVGPPAFSAPPVAPPPPAAAPPAVETRPGIDAPQWDAARDTYIQWDAELGEWMEWSESGGAWIPISQ